MCAHMTLAALWVYYMPKVWSWLPQWALAHLLLGVVLHRISPAKSKMKKHLQKCSDKPHIYRNETESEEQFGYERHSLRTTCGKRFVLVGGAPTIQELRVEESILRAFFSREL